MSDKSNAPPASNTYILVRGNLDMRALPLFVTAFCLGIANAATWAAIIILARAGEPLAYIAGAGSMAVLFWTFVAWSMAQEEAA